MKEASKDTVSELRKTGQYETLIFSAGMKDGIEKRREWKGVWDEMTGSRN